MIRVYPKDGVYPGEETRLPEAYIAKHNVKTIWVDDTAQRALECVQAAKRGEDVTYNLQLAQTILFHLVEKEEEYSMDDDEDEDDGDGFDPCRADTLWEAQQ